MNVSIDPRRLPATASSDEIRVHLHRVVESAAFRGSLRLTCFLTFVVETTLAGKGDTLKTYTIAVEALRRHSDFDPQTNPIVRVEAGRLRQALSRYYSGEGRDDSIVIDLLRGSYVPVFSQRGIPAKVHVTAAGACAHEVRSTDQIVLERLGKLRQHLALPEAEIENAATLLERSGSTR